MWITQCETHVNNISMFLCQLFLWYASLLCFKDNYIEFGIEKNEDSTKKNVFWFWFWFYLSVIWMGEDKSLERISIDFFPEKFRFLNESIEQFDMFDMYES